MDLTTRVNLVQNLLKTKELPVKTGATLLDINRTSVYYKGMPISQEELDCKSIIDRLHTDNPAWGARQLSAQLKKRGHQVGRRKTRRYMNEMGIDPIYPKMNLSKRMRQAKVCPYLLRNAVIDRPNQAWSIDITYIPIKRGFLYLTAVIDWYSRCIVGWEVDDTLDTRMVITALKKAFIVAKPVILNSDQGCQFTSNEYMNFLKENQIRQSMDGKSRWADNIMIERWFRSFKYEEAYLTQYNNIREARKAIGKYVHTYNFERCHSALNKQTPASCYYPILLLDDHAIKGLIKVHPLDKIAVTDIVTRSGMTRQTFYRYFKDKYELGNWYFEKLVLKSFRQMGDGCSLQEALQLKFAFIKSEHSFFKEAFKSNDYNNLD